jgi:hypothetical protein
MYSGQFFEMYSQSVHAERLTNAARRRLTNERMVGLATEQTSFSRALRRHLARIIVPRSLHAAVSQLPPLGD